MLGLKRESNAGGHLEAAEPAGDVSGLVLDDRVGKSGFGAKVSASNFRDPFLLAINGGAKLGASVMLSRSSLFLCPVL